MQKTMISTYMIMTALTTTALATTALTKGSTECNFSGRSETQQCFGAVGQLLIFHLPNAPNTEVRLTKDDKYLILKIVKNQIETAHKEYTNLSDRFTNGTIKLGKAMKRHSGDYLLEEFGSNGASLKKVKVHLQIQVPVSKPAVSQMCLSQEQMDITCSSEGDGVEFILTLDGLLLIQTRGHNQSPSSWTANMQSVAGNKTEQDKPSVTNVTISLHGQLTGKLLCNVWNNVSRDETVIHLQSCKDLVGSFHVVTVAVTAGVVTILLLVALCLSIKHQHYEQRPTTVINEGNFDEISDVVYTDVRVIKNRKSQTQLT
ncbi:uncharacterized protein LOC123963492 isoform X1 [Micropterus dolomieu]|uniref:uncharacterized protein LOC123963492 isoform X1 n=2 Tax=Micropterus dolomieu TaxID=147949 RepID=UPI001E8E4AFE|nr:uncharacterized protein LOC123963492 isoform X1 [Micropterus dolomieu]